VIIQRVGRRFQRSASKNSLTPQIDFSRKRVYFFHHPEILKDPMHREKMQSSQETILDRTLAVEDYKFVLVI
jgi:hypothetical protein